MKEGDQLGIGFIQSQDVDSVQIPKSAINKSPLKKENNNISDSKVSSIELKNFGKRA